MKKMIFALVAMVMMTMSASAQSESNKKQVSFDRLASYLELRIVQVEAVRTAMAQFNSSMEAYYHLQNASKGVEAWEKIQARHKATMKKILNEQQYDKYVKTFDPTVKNTSDRMIEKQMASK
jgi:uncharacterized protein YxeA